MAEKIFVVEAWFNLAGARARPGQVERGSPHLGKVIMIDAGHAKVIGNLVNPQYKTGHLVVAHRWWSRYVERDGNSNWSQAALRGIQCADLELTRKTAG